MRPSKGLKLLADENVPGPLVHLLRSRGIDVKWIKEIERGMPDKQVVSLSAEEDRVIVSLDKDFGKLIYRQKMKCPGVVLIRVRDESARNEVAYKMLEELGPGCYDNFVVITDKKTRKRMLLR